VVESIGGAKDPGIKDASAPVNVGMKGFAE